MLAVFRRSVARLAPLAVRGLSAAAVAMPAVALAHSIKPFSFTRSFGINGGAKVARVEEVPLSGERIAARAKQMQKVVEALKEKNCIPADSIEKEVKWYYDDLAFHDFYFKTFNADIVAQHVAAMYAAKLTYKTTGKMEMSIGCGDDEVSMRAVATLPGEEDPSCYKIEEQVNKKLAENYCISSYVTGASLSDEKNVHARMYIMTRGKFAQENAPLAETDLRKIADERFMARSSENTKKLYSEVIKETASKITPIIKSFEFEGSNERRVVVAWQQKANPNYFSEIAHLFEPNHVYTTRKYCDSFSNGVRVASFYLSPIDAAKPLSAQDWENVVQDISYAYTLPTSTLGSIAELGLKRNQQAYMFAASKFAHQFLDRYDEDYSQMNSILGNIPGSQPKILLANLKRRLRSDIFNEQSILSACIANADLIKEMYDMFSGRFNPKKEHPSEEEWNKQVKAMYNKIKKNCNTEFEVQVMNAINNMNHHMLKTNFYRTEKTALAFRLKGEFLSKHQYPVVPYGVFFIVGSEFRGFHARFSDIARGGIRVIKSANRQAYLNNVATQFDENYNLAYTQQKKNKDIPEGGSKGTILLNPDAQDGGERCFEKYVCSLMDVLVPECIQVDYSHREGPEILFLGPDEYTADLMAWAVGYTKSRNYQVWKAVTTGKPATLGGVPHDHYGMTTRSVHQYVLGTLAKLGIDEKKITKFQTGGPDGDLGSNEVLMAADKTIAVVDGSGVLLDSNGIDREELARLAKKRVMVREFNKSKLSPKGALVDINDKNVTLPDGTVVENGMAFRNNFHLNNMSAADLFVPCGGRPESINAANLPQVLNADGKCRWKWIIEGANLFVSQPARLELEKMGVILFKDASTNKGGVTSSSKEVTAALALSDEEFVKHMSADKNGKLPKFYKDYVQDIIACVEENAKLEFECLWKAHAETKIPMCELTDKVSLKINSVADGINASKLWENKKLRDVVFREALPPTLLKLTGLENFYARVPINYQRAIFSSYLGSQFVYKCGYNVGEFALFDFIRAYEAKSK